MPSLNIIIKKKIDKTPAIDLKEGEMIAEAELVSFIVLEGGMATGKTSVGFHFKLADGSQAFCQTSADIMKGMCAALLGAEQNFIDNIKQN